MCGIYGYILNKNKSLTFCLKRLAMLEYRGYDSSGISTLESKGFEIFKSTGNIKDLLPKVKGKTSKNVICHTRWATHGKICEKNAHPHRTQNISIVHNGIIDNYKELVADYNLQLVSECDSEVISALINRQTLKFGKNIASLIDAVCLLKGSFAFLAQMYGNPSCIYGAKHASPLYVGKAKNGFIFSSDLIAFRGLVTEYYELEDGEIFEANSKSITFYNLYKFKVNKKTKILEDNFSSIYLGKHSCFLEKEINDIPSALQRTYANYKTLNFNLPNLKNFECLHIIGCGTAYHSALAGKFIVEKFLKLPTYCHIASEFLFSEVIETRKALYVFISQSGETFDTLQCVKKIKELNYTTLAITNTVYSQITKLCSYCLPIFAGTEISVASTKVYNCTLLAFMFLCNANNIKIDEKMLHHIIKREDEIPLSHEMINMQKIVFIGKCEDYVTALEGCLKFKEITYKNCSALPSGELKHGTLSIVDSNCLVIAILTDVKYLKSITVSLQEVKTRGGKTAIITTLHANFDWCDYVIFLPQSKQTNTQLYSIIPLQKIALLSCQKLGQNPDRPRNLAKSVTVQ